MPRGRGDKVQLGISLNKLFPSSSAEQKDTADNSALKLFLSSAAATREWIALYVQVHLRDVGDVNHALLGIIKASALYVKIRVVDRVCVRRAVVEASTDGSHVSRSNCTIFFLDTEVELHDNFWAGTIDDSLVVDFPQPSCVWELALQTPQR